MSSTARVPEEALPLLVTLSGSPDPVFVTNRHNRIVFWNRSAERLLGYSAEEVVGFPCAGVLHGTDVYGNRYCSETCAVTQMAIRGEIVRHFDLRLHAKDRQMVTVDVTILNLAVRPPDHFLLVHVMKPSAKAEASELTAREVEVIGMLAAGHTTPEMASRLHISTVTARNHIQNILEKLEVHSKAEVVAFAFQKRLL